jgi:hypothetical protein
MSKWMCGCTMAVCCAKAFADSPPPAAPFTSISWKAVSVEKPATELRLGAFAMHFEETTLATVHEAVGSGEIQHQGDAGESVYWLCYTIEGSQRIWMMSHGEIGGPEHAVTSVTDQQIKGVKANKDCPSLPAKMQPVSLDTGFWLGTKDIEALKALGPASHAEGAWRSFDYQGKVPGSCEPSGFDLTNWLLYKIDNGRVTTIMASQITSC